MLSAVNLKEAAKICLFNASYLLGYPLCGPDTLQISLTNRCNLSCKMCSVRKYATPKDQEMSVAEIEKIIISVKRQFGVRRLILTGGEPLLIGSNVVDIARLAKKEGLSVIITTSAFFLAEYAHDLADSGVAHFHISIDGLRDVHNEIRENPLSFDKATEGIRILADIRSRNNLKYTIGVATVILRNNIKELCGLYKYADELKVDIFDLFPYLPDNTDFSSLDRTALWPDDRNLRDFNNVYKEICRLKTNHIRVNPYFDIRLIIKYYTRTISHNDWRCFAGFRNIFITMSDPNKTGRYEPCLFLCKEHIPIREHSYNLRKIWYSGQATTARLAVRRCDSYCYQMCFSLPPVFKVITQNN
ncbi:MAG TPA: hypothetical protein DEQ77_04180 [Candidatus Omnitrophica bacterium]|nr:hypothetical protein [Candidatus Omnitrophota bacterium]